MGNKNIYLLLILSFMIIPIVSSADWDNTLTYTDSDMKVSLENWLGLGKVLGTAELKSHSSVTEIKQVGLGNQVVMYYDFDFKELYYNGLGEVSFTDMRTGKEVEKDYRYVYWGNEIRQRPIYENQYCNKNGTAYACGVIENGKEDYTFEGWLSYSSKDIPLGKVRLGIEVDCKEGDYIDGVWEIGGQKIIKHAIWIVSGSPVVDANGQTITQGADSVSVPYGMKIYAKKNITINKITTTQGATPPTNVFIAFANKSIMAGSNATITSGVATYSQQVVLMEGNSYWVQADRGGASYTRYYDTTVSPAYSISGTNLNWTAGGTITGLDEPTVAYMILSLNTSEVTYVSEDNSPSLTLNSPSSANYTTSPKSLTINFTATDDINLKNVSLWVNGVLNQTNSSGLNNSIYLFPLTLGDGTYSIYGMATDNSSQKTNSSIINITIDSIAPTIIINSGNGTFGYTTFGTNHTINFTATDTRLRTCWYVYNNTNTTTSCTSGVLKSINVSVYASSGNVTIYANDSLGNVGSVYTSWGYHMLEINQTFSASTVETALEQFNINLKYISTNWTSSSAYLMYGDVNYTGIISGTGDNILISSDISISAVEEDGNVSFYWKILLTNITGTYTFNSSTQQQYIGRVNFSSCLYSENPQLFFKVFSTTSPTTPVNATFSSAWTIQSASNGEVVLSRSFEDLTETNSTFGFCIEPNSTTYTVSIDITIDAINYTPTSHYIIDTDYIGIADNISLYLLGDDDSTLTELNVVDRDNDPVKDVYISIQRYDMGTDTYYNVGMARTDNEGSDLAYLKWYDDWYRFIGYLNGEVVFTEGPKKVSSSPLLFTVQEDLTFAHDKFGDITYSLTFNNLTDNFVLSFLDPSGEVSSSCLRVIKRNTTNDYLICNPCETSNSATLYCNIGDWGNGTFIGMFYATGSPIYYIDLLYEIKNAQNELYDLIGNDNGTGMAIILAGIVLSFFLFSPAMGIVGAILGVIASVAVGLQPLEYLPFMGMAIAGGLILWAVQK